MSVLKKEYLIRNIDKEIDLCATEDYLHAVKVLENFLMRTEKDRGNYMILEVNRIEGKELYSIVQEM